jgi:ubiquitin-conjugating enzyme E2 D
MSIHQRLLTEIKQIKKFESEEDNHIFSIAPISDGNLKDWTGFLFGPKESSYQGGIFKISINFPDDYPFKPPRVYFITKVFHPNISPEGEICIDILKSNWSPALTIIKVMLSISSLLTDPNVEDPLNTEASKLYKHNKDEYEKELKQYVIDYAHGI